MADASTPHSLGPSPGALRHPEHKITITPSDAHCKVTMNGMMVADSNRTLVLVESKYGHVIYFPPEDVYTERLERSDNRTICPFKGKAHYFAANLAGGTSDVAWYYPQVYDEVSAIAGHVAFYADRVDLECGSESARAEETTLA